MSVVEISSFREWEAKHAASRSSGKAVRILWRMLPQWLCVCYCSDAQR